MPCGIMNESSFGLDNKRLAKGKSYMYAMWPKQWKILRREENRFFNIQMSNVNTLFSTIIHSFLFCCDNES